MRIFILSITGLSAFIGLAMTILPLGQIGVLPGIITILLAILAFWISKNQKKSTTLAIFFLVTSLFIMLGSGTKPLWTTDELAKDKGFEQKEKKVKQEALQELQEIESDLD